MEVDSLPRAQSASELLSRFSGGEAEVSFLASRVVASGPDLGPNYNGKVAVFYFMVKIDSVRGGDFFSGLSRRRYPENLLSCPRLAITRPRYFWYFWLTIQNTANRKVRNLFHLLAVFITFPLARAAALPHPTPPPLLLGEGSTKKSSDSKSWAWSVSPGRGALGQSR
jgi:hypothetical protein